MKWRPSNVPVVENDQHDPHWPWFLIGVTAPFALQSHDDGFSPSFETSASVSSVGNKLSNDYWIFKHVFKAPNSSVFKSAYSFKPTVDVYVGSAFHVETNS